MRNNWGRKREGEKVNFKNRKIWNQLKCGEGKQEFNMVENKEMKGNLRKNSVHASPCAGSVKDFIVSFFFVFIVPSPNIYKTESEGVKHHRTNARIYTLYSTIYRAIYSHRAHDMDESPEDHQGHIKQLYCTLFPALHPLRTLIYSSAPHKENKGVTRPLLTAVLPGCADVTAEDSSYSSSTQKKPCSWRSCAVWYAGTGPLDHFQSQLARRYASFHRWHL